LMKVMTEIELVAWNAVTKKYQLTQFGCQCLAAYRAPHLRHPTAVSNDEYVRAPGSLRSLYGLAQVASKARPGACLASADRQGCLISPVMEKVTFTELPINVIAWISVPNKAYDLYKKLAVSPELGVTRLQKRKRSTAYPRVF
jgi:hypothetical protein